MVLSFIILGLLNYQPMTGYDLKAFFNRTINFFWSAELSQIYRELSKLEEKGCISYRMEYQENRPDKKVYSITQKGQRVFQEWLNSFPITLSPNTRNEFLVRIFFSSRIADEDIMFQFKRYIKEMEEELKIYRVIEEKININIKEGKNIKENTLQKFTVRRGIIYAQAEISWANECIEEIKNFNEINI